MKKYIKKVSVNKITTEQAVNKLIHELKKDKEFRETWKASISMAYIDTVNRHMHEILSDRLSFRDRNTVADKAAEYFLKQLCGELKVPKGR